MSWRCVVWPQMAIMLELNHPNIIKLLDYFEKKDHYFMVVEKVRGEECCFRARRCTTKRNIHLGT